jgi:hypothetical protein
MDIVLSAASLLAAAVALVRAVERLLPLIWEPAHKRQIAMIKARRQSKK